MRGVDALVLRPMNVALPPDADWVHITFQTAGDDGGPSQQMSQEWLVRFTPLDAGGAASSAWLPLSTSAGQAAADTEAAPPAQPAIRTIQDEVGFSMDAPGNGAGTLRDPSS